LEEYSQSYNTAIVLLGIYPNEMKTYVHTKACTTDISGSYIHNFHNLEETKIFLVGEWINKMSQAL
jgi:hypothetical protein